MIKVKHISDEQVNQLVGKQLGVRLWLNGMMNELRRYPNEIPCEFGEIPSMRIPFAEGEEKVEWGFTAGMSCLIKEKDGSILVQNAEHFPACAVLAILSLLYDVGAANGKKISLTLQIPESPQMKEFNDLLSEAESALKNTTIKKVKAKKKTEVSSSADRKVFPLGGSMAVVQGLQQVDIGRFVAKVQCVNGSFHVGDDATVVDGGFRVLQEHCPVTYIVGMDNTEVKNSDELDEDAFFLGIAMWFPPATPPFNRLNIFVEKEPPAFTPRTMPETSTNKIAEAITMEEGISNNNTAEEPAAKSEKTLDVFLKEMHEKDSFNKAMEIAKSEIEELIRNGMYQKITNKNVTYEQWNTYNETQKEEIVISMGLFSFYKQAVICVDFIKYTAYCPAIGLLLAAWNGKFENQILDAGDRVDVTKFVEALTLLHGCYDKWECTIMSPVFVKIGSREKEEHEAKTETTQKTVRKKKSFWDRLFGK